MKSIRKKQKESVEENENYRNYSIIQNIIYALQTAFKYKKSLAYAIVIGSISYAIYELIVIYFPKIVIDMISNNCTINKLVIVTVILCIVTLIFDLIWNFCWYKRDWDWELLCSQIVNERLHKNYTTDYSNMENPEFLDFMQRARRSTFWGSGFRGIYQRIYYLISQFLMVIISGTAIIVLNPLIALIVCVLAFFTYKIFDNTMIEDKKKHSDVLAPTYRKLNYMSRLTRNFDFAKDIRLFHMNHWIGNIFNKLNRTYIDNFTEHHKRWIVCDAKMNTIVLIQTSILYIWLVYMVLFKEMTIGNFILYVGMVNALSKNFTDLFSNLSFLNNNRLELNDFRTMIEWPDAYVNREKGEGTLMDIELDSYEFVFENVSFKYPGSDKYALKNVNLTLSSKMKLAIVGINGAGKTTFTKLLMRLYEPTEGRILLNGIDVKRYDRNIYYQIFSPVFQNIECFAVPIWQNVSLRDEAHTDMDKVQQCIKISGLDRKLSHYEKGIDTQMLKIFHRDGVDLSGGEKQRLAMARALYKNGSVIVLDEPTAALDAVAEDKMYQEFNKMVENKTSIFISHRLSSTRFCDKIAMFDKGKIIEFGTHDELIEQNGKYAEMYNVQAQYYRDKNDKQVTENMYNNREVEYTVCSEGVNK